MTLRENGKSRSKKTVIKCSKCRERFNLEDVGIEKIGNVKYCECPVCGQQEILKNN